MGISPKSHGGVNVREGRRSERGGDVREEREGGVRGEEGRVNVREGREGGVRGEEERVIVRKGRRGRGNNLGEGV